MKKSELFETLTMQKMSLNFLDISRQRKSLRRQLLNFIRKNYEELHAWDGYIRLSALVRSRKMTWLSDKDVSSISRLICEGRQKVEDN